MGEQMEDASITGMDVKCCYCDRLACTCRVAMLFFANYILVMCLNLTIL